MKLCQRRNLCCLSFFHLQRSEAESDWASSRFGETEWRWKHTGIWYPGILVSSDKFIDRDYAKSVRRYLSMTKVFQILEEEKQEAINLAEKKGANAMIEKFIKAGADTLMIMQATGLTKEEIEEIKKNMLTTK